MRIVVNGWFLDQLTTGSGQYLAALAEWLPRAAGGHEFIIVESANRRIGESANQRIGESANQRIGESANQRIGESANQRIGESANQRINESANQRISESANRRIGESANQRIDESTVKRGTDSLIRHSLIRSLAKLWFEQVTFPRACRRLAADVAFVPYWGSPWWRPCPVVVTVHDLIPLLLSLYRGGPLQRAYTWLVSHTARRAAAVLTDSEASKRDIVAHLGIPAARVHAIHLAADPRFRAVTDPGELDRVRARYRLPAAPFLLYLGGFDARKNVERTVAAYAKMIASVGRQGPEVRLVIAGKLPEADTAFAPDPRRVVTRLGMGDRVHFTGWVDEADKPALYTLALGTVFVSEYEGFGLPVLEAMGCDLQTSLHSGGEVHIVPQEGEGQIAINGAPTRR